MADPKDKPGLLRKVARFIANPATDWADLNSPDLDTRALDVEKSELKQMIERKRRNDFVRKREFDMLRKVRREGLSPEQLAALGGSSRLDDSEARAADSHAPRPDGVKAKIDAIEQQMVGDTVQSTIRRASGFFGTASSPAPLDRRPTPPPAAPPPPPPALVLDDDDELPALPPLVDDGDALPSGSKVGNGAGLPPLASNRVSVSGAPPSGAGPAVEVSEVVHDPELDEAVIAFANADFALCEQALTRLTREGGGRADHAETWLVLFDLFRAIGQQQRFEALAVDYAHRFGWSAPQWYSLPQLVADAVAEERPATLAGPLADEVGWVAPEILDIDAVARLRSQTLQMPLPWVFDWAALKQIDAEAATQLSVLCRVWSGQPLEMRWLAGDKLFQVLQEAAPTGVRDADPAFWLARLDALRLVNRADQFDEAAIDYCVTYEVSPPSWEATRCKIQIGGSSHSTRTPPLSVVGDVSTSFLESGLQDDAVVEVSTVDLSGQLIGDISETVARLDGQVGRAPMVSVSCSRLIRVDFLAAGDLLNWVMAKRGENRTVQFVEAHRLVALFFGAMGISEHASVQLRKV